MNDTLLHIFFHYLIDLFNIHKLFICFNDMDKLKYLLGISIIYSKWEVALEKD